MMGENDVEVVEVRRLDVHGVGYVDLAVRFADGSTGQARLGSESVPDDLRTGEHVLVTRVANMIVSVRRGESG